jgi:hypothetical protein
MMLGDLLARFGDETNAVDAIFSLGDLRMVAVLRRRAEAEGLGFGAFVARALRRYVDASDERWTTLLSSGRTIPVSRSLGGPSPTLRARLREP